MIIDDLVQKMDYSSKRREVISQNIANINTPGFLSKDLEEKKDNSASKFKNIVLTKTNSAHLTSRRLSFAGYNTQINRKRDYMKLDGNNVNLESESMKYTKNNVKYEEYLLLYKKWINIMKSMFSNVSR
ncbi:flagellar basal body rod protein FlgB [Anaplasmataceae bacterium AB001_6]|nr:flagellar basal body rod protein FlgB [Anaplasmataceae bacterium AB001_6]